MRNIICQQADNDDLHDTHAHCLSNSGDQHGNERRAVQDRDPQGIQAERPDDLRKQHRCQNISHPLFFVQEEAIAESGDERRQREAGEVRAGWFEKMPV